MLRRATEEALQIASNRWIGSRHLHVHNPLSKSHFILHSQEPSSWNPLPEFSCRGEVISAPPSRYNHLASLLHYYSFFSFTGPLFHCLLFFILANWHRAGCGGQSSHVCRNKLTPSLGCATWSIQNQTSFHMHLHVAARKHAASPVNFYIFLCMYASYRCQGCSRVYLHPPYHSMKWERWFVGGSGAFVWQILVNIMDLYIRNSLK